MPGPSSKLCEEKKLIVFFLGFALLPWDQSVLPFQPLVKYSPTQNAALEQNVCLKESNPDYFCLFSVWWLGTMKVKEEHSILLAVPAQTWNQEKFGVHSRLITC